MLPSFLNLLKKSLKNKKGEYMAILGGLKPLERLFKKKSKGDLKGALMGIATIFIILYVLAIVLGNLTPVMTDAIPTNSTLAPAVDGLESNVVVFFQIGGLIGLIAIAMLIINILT